MADKRQLEQLFNLKASFPTEKDQRAFFKAARDNDIKTLANIIEKWPDSVTKWESAGDPVIGEAYRQMNPQTLAFLIEKGADINQYGNNKFWNPLSSAAHGGDAASIQELLRLGAEIDAKNRCGQTALYWAAHEKKLECVDLLVLCGADPGQGFEGSKDESVREVIRLAGERRQKFLADPTSQAKADIPAPAPKKPAPVADENVIRILKRIELKKTGRVAGSEPQSAPKKNWVKRILGR